MNVFQNSFIKVAGDVLSALGKKNIPYAEIACPDQIVGRIGDFQLGTDFPRRINVEKGVTTTSDTCVILILESPHKDEFSVDADGELNPIGPARGCTGCAIRNYFGEIFGKIIPGYEKSDLALVNLVQYQCSLGLPTQNEESVKNDILLRLLNAKSDGEDVFIENFKRRVALVEKMYNESLIVNACTKAGGWNNRVKEALEGRGGVINEIGHPCTWCRNWKSLKERVEEGAFYVTSKTKQR